jgi:hypothetical protein
MCFGDFSAPVSVGASKPANQERPKTSQGIAVKKCGDWMGLGLSRHRHSRGRLWLVFSSSRRGRRLEFSCSRCSVPGPSSADPGAGSSCPSSGSPPSSLAGGLGSPSPMGRLKSVSTSPRGTIARHQGPPHLMSPQDDILQPFPRAFRQLLHPHVIRDCKLQRQPILTTRLL